MPPRQVIFGGTFDPPHIGHLAVVRCAQAHLAAEAFHVVVANDPWQKSAQRSVTPASHRLAMARLAFGGLDGIVVSDLEIRRGGPTYTIDTVAELERPDTETVLVVGPDAAAGVSSWHRTGELAGCVTLAVVQPPGEHPIRIEGWRTETVYMAPVEASASRVRESLAGRGGCANAGAAAKYVTAPVMGYIVEHGLYSPSV